MLIVTGEQVCEPRAESALDTIEREFDEQGMVPDHIESTRYVEGDGSDLMTGIEDLHPVLGKQEQQVQDSDLV